MPEVHLHDGHINVRRMPSENQNHFPKYVIVAAVEHFLFIYFFCSPMNVYRAKEERGRSHRPDGKADTEQTRCSLAKVQPKC